MSDLDENLQCPICLDLCREAVECSRCHNIFCQECTSSLNQRQCPVCRSSSGFSVAHLARRMIENLKTKPKKCDKCHANITIRELAKHTRECSQDKKQNTSNDIEKSKSKISALKGDSLSNSSDHKAYLGNTGKYYCGGLLEDAPCNCCNNGVCGPIDGPNCGRCMALDIKQRNLPKGVLVNDKGLLAKKSTETGYFSCGTVTYISMKTPYDYKYCTPSMCAYCKSCERLNKHSRQNMRYASLL